MPEAPSQTEEPERSVPTDDSANEAKTVEPQAQKPEPQAQTATQPKLPQLPKSRILGFVRGIQDGIEKKVDGFANGYAKVGEWMEIDDPDTVHKKGIIGTTFGVAKSLIRVPFAPLKAVHAIGGSVGADVRALYRAGRGKNLLRQDKSYWPNPKRVATSGLETTVKTALREPVRVAQEGTRDLLLNPLTGVVKWLPFGEILSKPLEIGSAGLKGVRMGVDKGTEWSKNWDENAKERMK